MLGQSADWKCQGVLGRNSITDWSERYRERGPGLEDIRSRWDRCLNFKIGFERVGQENGNGSTLGICPNRCGKTVTQLIIPCVPWPYKRQCLPIYRWTSSKSRQGSSHDVKHFTQERTGGRLRSQRIDSRRTQMPQQAGKICQRP